jgi:hypothetical protein
MSAGMAKAESARAKRERIAEPFIINDACEDDFAQLWFRATVELGLELCVDVKTVEDMVLKTVEFQDFL